MDQVQKMKSYLTEILWGKVEFENLPKVDNKHVDQLMKGGYIFGFTASDLLIVLSAILTLIFLQIQPFLIPYLEGRLDLSTFQVIENRFNEEQVFERSLDVVSKVDKSVSTSSATQTSSPSSSLQEELTSGNQILNTISLTTSKDTYKAGGLVEFTITNNSKSIIYFSYGCSRPLIVKNENKKLVSLLVSITEEVPATNTVKPNQSVNCSWDQMIWQDSSLQGIERYKNYVELIQVPSGEFQLHLEYFLDELNVVSNKKAKTIWSQKFRIE